MIDLAHAQGIDRESLSGESVAEELRQSGDNQPYNVKLGPVAVRVDADLTTSYNDNITLSKNAPIGDFIITPATTLRAEWKVTDLNTLKFSLGLGYQMYVSHSEADSILISPDSEATFNFFLGPVAFKVRDAFSYQQDPTQIGQLSNTVKLERFTNDAGFTATWDVGAFVLSLDYDHVNFWVTSSVYDYLTNTSDTIAPKVTYKVNDSIQTGLSTSFSDVRYQQSFQNDYRSASFGPFVTAQVSSNLSINAQGGGYISDYQHGGGNGDSENVNSFYGSLGLNHRINDNVSEAFEAGREFLPGLSSNFTDRIYANYTATWRINKNMTSGANLLWENLKDSAAFIRETSDRYGLGLSFSDTITEHVTLNANYQYLLKVADPSIDGYEQNTGTVGVSYQF